MSRVRPGTLSINDNIKMYDYSMRSHIKPDESVIKAMIIMGEILKQRIPRTEFSKRNPGNQISPFDKTGSCGGHENCEAHKATLWKIISGEYPSCRSRRYVGASNVVYFVVLAEVSELSRQLSRASSECEAWERAAHRLVQEHGC